MKTHLRCRVEIVDGIGRLVRAFDSVLCAGAKREDWPQTLERDEVTCKRCLRRMASDGGLR